jgi:glycerol-3-phosphate O-acyltransferase
MSTEFGASELQLDAISMQSPLFVFNTIRTRILDEVVKKTEESFRSPAIENELTAALYLERQRLRRSQKTLFTRSRLKRDQRIWNDIQRGLLKSATEVDRLELFQKLTRHYAEEIGGHFSQDVYGFVTKVVPLGFDVLLNAASLNTLLPWKMTEEVEERMHLTGEIQQLRELSKKGTILLVPTHQSNIDSILIGYVIYLLGLPPFAYGAGLNLFSNPALNFFMGNLGTYKVDRLKSNKIYKTLLKNYSTRIIREGVHSIFFPGGGRSRSGAIESKLKLGLLGTGLEAELENLQAGNPKARVYIVPMVMSYHFVLEASSLVEDYLAESGKHQFIISDDESSQFSKVLNFFWQLFKGESKMTVRIGRALDVFGNFVDENGNSIGPNGTEIQTKEWLTSGGELKADPQRDHIYTENLGKILVKRFHAENTVLTSHITAFAFFECLRSNYPDLDLYRFLRLSTAQRVLSREKFNAFCLDIRDRLAQLEKEEKVHLSPELHQVDSELWIEEGLKYLGSFHGNAVLKKEGEWISTEDMNLLYYYRNRLAGYGLSRLADPRQRLAGKHDEKGFLV